VATVGAVVLLVVYHRHQAPTVQEKITDTAVLAADRHHVIILSLQSTGGKLPVFIGRFSAHEIF
jgi:hypothetical protein